MNNKKILVFDLGNTSCHFGLFSGGRLVKDWRLETKNIYFAQKLNLPAADISIGCSVVPALGTKIKKLVTPAPTMISWRNIPDIKIKVDHPSEVGADRLVNALAVYKKYRRPAIIIDAGTAITIDIVSRQGEYLGGIIFPGVNLCAAALAQGTARLPLVTVEKPKNLVGKNTVECLRSGLYYGISSMINCLVARIQKTSRQKFLVVGTGGNLELLSLEINGLDIQNKFITLEGLQIAAEEI